jgi:ankyrin repeat protein
MVDNPRIWSRHDDDSTDTDSDGGGNGPPDDAGHDDNALQVASRLRLTAQAPVNVRRSESKGSGPASGLESVFKPRGGGHGARSLAHTMVDTPRIWARYDDDSADTDSDGGGKGTRDDAGLDDTAPEGARKVPPPEIDAHSALIDAATRGDVSRVAALLEQHRDARGEGILGPGTADGRTALHAATLAPLDRRIPVARLLLSAGVDAAALDHGSASACHLAMGAADIALHQLLAAHLGAQTARDLEAGDVPGAMRCAAAGADLLTEPVPGCTLLALAAQQGCKALVEAVLASLPASRQAAWIDRAAEAGQTAMHRAAARGHRAVYEVLRQAGGNDRVPDATGRTPRRLWMDQLRRALQAGANAEALAIVRAGFVGPADEAIAGRTLLSYAASGRHAALLRALLEPIPSRRVRTALIDTGDARGRTAMHWAAEVGNREVYGILLQAGGTDDVRCDRGVTPAELARELRDCRGIDYRVIGLDAERKAFASGVLRRALETLSDTTRRALLGTTIEVHLLAEGHRLSEVHGLVDDEGAAGQTSPRLDNGTARIAIRARHLAADVLCHEFGHVVHLFGLTPQQRAEVSRLYEATRRGGRFISDYARTNAEEYFCEGVSAFLGEDGNAQWRAALRQTDGGLYAMLRRVFDPAG